MSLHIAASGAKAGQWVKCNAKHPGNCPNIKKDPNSPHISNAQLYGMKEWAEEQDNRTVYIKDLGKKQWDNYSKLPAQEQNIYEKIAKDKQKEAKEKRDAAKKAATQRRREETRIGRELPGILATHRKKPATSNKTSNPKFACYEKTSLLRYQWYSTIIRC